MIRRTAFVVLLALFAVACSVPTDDAALVINSEDLPEELQAGLATTTIPAPVNTETVIVFFVRDGGDGTEPILQPVERPARRNILRFAIEALLSSERTEEELQEGLFNPLAGSGSDDPDAEREVIELLGIERPEGQTSTAILDLSGFLPGDLVGLEQAFAQLAFTALAYSGVNRVGIRINGETQPIPTEDEGLKDLVTEADFPSLDPEREDADTEDGEDPSPTTTEASPTTTTG